MHVRKEFMLWIEGLLSKTRDNFGVGQVPVAPLSLTKANNGLKKYYKVFNKCIKYFGATVATES